MFHFVPESSRKFSSSSPPSSSLSHCLLLTTSIANCSFCGGIHKGIFRKLGSFIVNNKRKQEYLVSIKRLLESVGSCFVVHIRRRRRDHEEIYVDMYSDVWLHILTKPVSTKVKRDPKQIMFIAYQLCRFYSSCKADFSLICWPTRYCSDKLKHYREHFVDYRVMQETFVLYRAPSLTDLHCCMSAHCPVFIVCRISFYPHLSYTYTMPFGLCICFGCGPSHVHRPKIKRDEKILGNCCYPHNMK